MIQINPNTDQNIVIPRVDGTPKVLVFHSELTQKNYEFEVTDSDTSKNYFKFIIDATDVPEGEYNYELFSEDGDCISQGLIKVGDVEEEYGAVFQYSPKIKYRQYYPTVRKWKKTSDLTVNQTTTEDAVVLGVQVNNDATGIVSAVLDGSSTSEEVRNGRAAIEMSNIDYYPGSYEVEVIYSGDRNYKSAVTTSSIVIPKRKTDIEISMEDITEGETAIITVYVPYLSTGTIVLTIDSDSWTETICDGKVIYEITGLTVGTYIVSVSYSGDDAYLPAEAASTINVTPTPVPPTPTSGFNSMYFTVQALEDGTFTWTAPNMQYSVNNRSWNNWEGSLEVTSGTLISFKSSTNTAYDRYTPTTNFHFDVFGNSMSLFYGDNFSGQTTLPAMYALEHFFKESNVMNAQNLVLPATTVKNYAYEQMFYGCTSLVTTPVLPATTIKEGAYSEMFQGCTSLTYAPSLPATTLAGNCYENMFNGCTALANAPELPATTLAIYCYSSMFYGCTSLVQAPDLPATTLSNYCYQSMFNGCTSLVNAPELPAATLTNYCYKSMFRGCSNLSYIKCLATSISATNCTNDWVNGVAASGTFVKDENMSSWTLNSNNGIPNGWTVTDDAAYETKYFTIKSLEDNNTISWDEPYLECSVNNGAWTAWEYSYILNANETIRFRKVATYKYRYQIGATKYYEAYGNIMSLVYGDNFVGQTTLTISYIFEGLFAVQLRLMSVENLVLPATTLSEGCYKRMFYSCGKITKAPVLPAETLTPWCYDWMFNYCDSLNYVKCLATDISALYCLSEWLQRVSDTGTFVKKSGSTWPLGWSGIPNRWTIYEE